MYTLYIYILIYSDILLIIFPFCVGPPAGIAAKSKSLISKPGSKDGDGSTRRATNKKTVDVLNKQTHVIYMCT